MMPEEISEHTHGVVIAEDIIGSCEACNVPIDEHTIYAKTPEGEFLCEDCTFRVI